MLSLSQKQVQNLRMLMFVNHMIIGFRSPNFSQRCMLVSWDRINRHFGLWRRNIIKYYKSQPFGTESSQFLAERNALAASLAVIAKCQVTSRDSILTQNSTLPSDKVCLEESTRAGKQKCHTSRFTDIGLSFGPAHRKWQNHNWQSQRSTGLCMPVSPSAPAECQGFLLFQITFGTVGA